MTESEAREHMSAALAEGRKALPHCLPNPPVGCVIVRRGEIVASGHTSVPGGRHAEAMALDALGRNLVGHTVFVTLEPCSFHGRTPSCALALIAKRIERIHVSILDPDPRNSGRGVEMLRRSGAVVTMGVLAEEARRDLSPYLQA